MTPNTQFEPAGAAPFGRQLLGDALYLYVLQGLNFLVPLATLPYLLRVLGPQSYGGVLFALALAGYAVVLTDYGFNLAAARDLAVARADAAAVGRIYWTTMAAKGWLLLAAGAGLCLCVALVPPWRAEWRVYAVCGTLVLGSVAFPQWYFQGLGRLREAAVFQLLAKCLVTAGIFVVVKSPAGVLPAAFLLSAPQLLGALTAAVLGRSLPPPVFYRPTAADVAAALRGAWHLFAGNVATSLYLQTPALVLGLLEGKGAVAYYGLGYSLVLAVQALSGPLTQSLFPRASALFAADPHRAQALVTGFAERLLPAMGLACLLLCVFAPTIVGWIGGTAYAASVPVVRIMAAAPLLITVATLLGPITMVGLGLTRELMQIYLGVGGASIVLLPVLVSALGANGAAISLLLAEAAGPLAMGLVLWRRRRR